MFVHSHWENYKIIKSNIDRKPLQFIKLKGFCMYFKLGTLFVLQKKLAILAFILDKKIPSKNSERFSKLMKCFFYNI